MLSKFSDLESLHITLAKVRHVDFTNALAKYVKHAVSMFYDAAVDTYDRDQFGSFKSTLRSTKFLQKIDSKVNSRMVKLQPKALPDLAQAARSVKLV
jgi:hypothetical protein